MKLGLLVTVLLTTRCEFGSGFRSTRFLRLDSDPSVVPGCVQSSASSTLECGVQCARSSSCKAFCHSESTAVCYLSENPAFHPFVDEVADVTCFRLVYCPVASGYGMYGTRCIKGVGQSKDYDGAKAHCALDGGHLYHYKTLEWDRPPIVLLKAEGGFSGDLLLGADDLQTQGLYLWSDSTPVTPPPAGLWVDGQPNGYGTDRQSCIRLKPSLLLADNICDDPTNFVCQIDL